jgi:hypothetical protein
MAYKALSESEVLKQHYGAGSMLCTIVTTSAVREQNLLNACERAQGDHRFCVTTFDRLQEDFLRAPIWRFAGRGDSRDTLLP